MKKLTSFVLAVIALFSCFVFSACGDKYKKMEMTFCSSTGSEIEEVFLIKDEANNKGLDKKRLGVKFSGVKEKYIGQILVYSYPENVVNVDNYVYDGDVCYFDVKAMKSSILEDTKLIVKHLTTDKTESIKLKIEEKSYSLNVNKQKYVVAVNRPQTHTLNIKQLVSLIPAGSTDEIYFKHASGSLPQGITYETHTIEGEDYITGFTVNTQYNGANANSLVGSIKLYPVTNMEGYTFDAFKYQDKLITINFDIILEGLFVNVGATEFRYKDSDTGELLGGTEENPIQLVVNNFAGDELFNEILLRTDLKTLITDDVATTITAFNVSDFLQDYELKIDSPTCLTCTDIGNGHVLVNTGFSAVPVCVKLSLIPLCLGDSQAVTGEFWIQPVVRADDILVSKYGSDGVDNISNGQIVDIYTDYVNNNGIIFKFDAVSDSDLVVSKQFDYSRIEINPEVLYTEMKDGFYENIYISEDEKFNGANLPEGTILGTLSNQKNLVSIVKGNELLKFYIKNGKLVSEKISSNDEIYIKCVKTLNTNTDKSFEFDVISNYEGDLSYLNGMEDARITLKFEAYETIKELNVYAAKHIYAGFEMIQSGGVNKLANTVYLDIMSVDKFSLTILSDSSAISTNDKVLTSDVKLSYKVTSEKSVNTPFTLATKLEGLIEINNNDSFPSLDVDTTTNIGKYTITFVQGKGDNGFKKEITVYVYKSFSNIESEDNVLFNVVGLDENSFVPNASFKTTYEIDEIANYVVKSNNKLTMETNINKDIIDSGIIAGYSYDYEIVNAEEEIQTINNNPKTKFFSNKTFEDRSRSELYFLDGTIIDETKYYIQYTIKVNCQTYDDILTPGEISQTPFNKYFYIYNSIQDYDGISINHPYLTKYMEEDLGHYYMNESIATLSILLKDNSYWHYVDDLDADGKKIEWSKNVESVDPSCVIFNYTSVKGDLLNVSFAGQEGFTFYKCKIIATMYQFGKPYVLQSEITVKEPILTTSLLSTTPGLTFDTVKSNIYHYSVNLHLNDELVISAEHMPADADNKELKLVVVDSNGNRAQNIAEIHPESNKIIIKQIQAGYKLIVYSKDALKINIDGLTKDFQNYNIFVKNPVYFVINLELEDGDSEETAYSVYNITDFEKMIADNVSGKSVGKYYRIRNNINLSQLDEKYYNVNFNGHILSQDNAVLYDLKLDNNNFNLFKTYTGTMKNITFDVKYSYDNSADTYLGVIGELLTGSKITDVAAVISGDIKLASNNKMGGLIGLNSGDEVKFTENFVATKGSLNITGVGGYFGGYIAENCGKVEGANRNESTLDVAGVINPIFSSYEGGNLATSELILDVDNASSTIGGVVGLNKPTGSVSGVFVAGQFKITNALNVGGVIGENRWNVISGWNRVSTANVGKLSTTFNSNLKSNVKIEGGTNVGGIVGFDEYGCYDYSWYQILPNETNAVLTGKNVGAIVGFAKGTKLYFSSVVSYRWDYLNLWDDTDKVSVFNDKNPDIKATDYAGGLIGLTNAVSTNVSTEIDMKDNVVIQYSSVNAYVWSDTAYVGGLFATDNKIEGQVVKVGYEFVPVYHSYFIGKLSTPNTDTNILSVSNKETTFATENVYSINVKENDGLYTAYGDFSGNNITTLDNLFWNYYSSLNGGYIYVSSDENENKPNFEIVPNDLKVYEGSDETDKTIILNYYNFNSMGYSIDKVREYNNTYNTYEIKDLLTFDSTTKGDMRIFVKSSDNNTLSISGGSLVVNSASKADITLTFIPVLNPNISATITVKIEVPLSEIEISEDGMNEINVLRVAKETSKKLSVKSYGVIEPDGISYRSNNEFGLYVTIKSNYLEDYDLISNYLKISGLDYISDSYSISKVYVPFGTTFSIKANEYYAEKFIVEVYPAMYEDDTRYTTPVKAFDLYTYRGATDITLSYDSAIIYPNDITTITARISTDIPIDNNNDLLNMIVRGYLKIGTEVENGISQDDLKTVFTVVSYSFDAISQIETVIYKLDLSKFESLEEKYHLSDKEVSILTVNFKTNDGKIEKTIRYDILPQMIDKIDLSPYVYVGTYEEGNPNNKIELLSVLKPNKVGLAVINVAPSNAYYDYIEISDVTGNEEIKFIQVNGIYGERIETLEMSKNGKGIKLETQGLKTLYVLMQIDKDYSSKPHTIRVSAYYKNEILRTDEKIIDVKMLPSINVEYQLPNGTGEFYETDSSGNAVVATQYFANGTEAQFRILTANVTEELQYEVIDDESGIDIAHNFVFTKLHNDFYVLKCVNASALNLGETIKIRLKASATVNGTTDEAMMEIPFQIVKFVIHGISATHTIDNNLKTEIYGNLYNTVKLEFYFKATDITFNYNGAYNNVDYRYDPDLSSSNDSITSINNILKVLNNKDNTVTYNSDSEIDDSFTFVTLNNGLRPTVETGKGSRLKNKYITDNIDVNEKIDITSDTTNGNTIYVEEGYDNKLKYAIDFNLNLDTNGDTVNDWNWTIIKDNNTGMENISKNYDLSFVHSSSQQDYLLIKDENDFINIASGEKNYYILGKDLVLENYTPIDINVAEFDGNGHTITIRSFAKFAEAEIQAGLFKSIPQNMMVKNLNVRYQSTVKETVYSFGTVAVDRANSPDGGVVNFVCTYADLCNDETVNYTKASFAGLTPLNNGVITNCSVSGRIALRASSVEGNSTGAGSQYSTNFNIAGLVGVNAETGYITNSSSEMQIFALANIGGFVFENKGKIASCEVGGKSVIYAYNTSVDQTIVAQVAGFVVTNSGEISMSNNTTIYSGVVTDYQGIMSSKDISSGFVYSNSGEIYNSYVELSKIGNNNNTFTGFVYTNSGTIQTCYTCINQGEQTKTNISMFALKDTKGLIDCVEFVNLNTPSDLSSYLNNNGSTNLYNYNFEESSNFKLIFEKHNFVFGDNESAVWTITGTRVLPSLVSCLENVSFNTTANSGEYYYGVRDFIYKKETINYPDGTVSYKMKVQFVNDTYGSKVNPYIIRNLEEFDSEGNLAGGWNYYFTNETTAYYRIVADIVFSSIGNPVTSTHEFKGNIQGNDMLLSNIKLYVPESEVRNAVGLFAKLVSANDVTIKNSVRNLKIKTTSIWASKGKTVGSLAGTAIDFNIYNIKISTGNENIVGGNAVGGLVGYAGGKLNIDGISTDVSVTSTMEILTNTYSIFISNNNVKNSNNLNSVYYAGSVVGILDAYDSWSFNVHNARDISKDYYNVKHVSLTGSIVNVGTIVGGVFGFVGERVFVEYVDVNIESSMLKGGQYSACVAGENRGVISEFNVLVDGTENEDSENTEMFRNAQYVSAGVVGFNVGGLVQNGSASVDIIKGTTNAVVGGIVGRNVGGTVNNVTFSGKIIGMVTGAIIGTDYSRTTIITHSTGVSVLNSECRRNTNLLPNNYIVYSTNSEIIEMSNLKITQRTLNYYYDNAHLLYTIENGNQNSSLFNVKSYYAFGLVAGYTDVDTDKKYETLSGETFVSSQAQVEFANGVITINVSSSNAITGNSDLDYDVIDNKFTISNTEAVYIEAITGLVSEDGWYSWIDTIDNSVMDLGDTFNRQYPLEDVRVLTDSSLDRAFLGQIVGAKINNNNFDTWSKDKGYTKNFVILANL